MLLPARIAQGVREGTVTLAFRRWEEPRVRVGGTQLTSAGIVAFDAVAGSIGKVVIAAAAPTLIDDHPDDELESNVVHTSVGMLVIVTV